MERLTMRNPYSNNTMYRAKDNSGGHRRAESNDKEWCEIIDRLSEYEDTGLTPEEIKEYKKFEDELVSKDKSFNHIITMLNAEEQGLLIKLPTPIHKYLYDIHYGNVQKYRAIGYEIDIDGKWYVKIPYGRIPFTDFGVKVFLTREAAEEALRGSVPE